MSGPWENYSAPVSDGPWAKYGTTAPSDTSQAVPQSTLHGGYKFGDELFEQGALLGFGDEVTAGINTGIDTLRSIIHGQPTDVSGTYDRNLAQRRAQKDEWERAHPVAKYVAGGLGMLAGAAPAKAVAAVATAAPKLGSMVKQGLGIGAAVGGATGFGSGEGGFENRALSGAGGAAVGGIIGAGAPLAVEGARAGVAAGKALTGLSSSDEVATNQINTALARSGRTPEEVSSAVADANAMGVPAVPADTSPSLRRLGRAVETVPGQASDAVTRLLDERQTGQGARVSGQIRRALGTDGDALSTADQIIAARKEQAKPLYEQAYQADGVWSPELESLLKTPSGRAAFARAKIIAADERRPPEDLAVIGYRLNPGDFGSYGQSKGPIQGQTPSMQSWDYIKRGLDDIIEKYRNPVTGKLVLDERGRAVLGVKNQILSELDAINPDYANARKVFAGHSEMLDALHMGQRFSLGDTDMTARRFGALSDGEKDMYRVGAVNQLRTTIQNAPDGADIVRRVFGTPDRRARMAMLFKDPAEFQTFSRIMDLERETTRTARMVTGGSPTARIQAEQSDLIVGAVEDALRGRGPMAMAINAGRRMLTRAKGMNDETANRIASYVFNPNPQASKHADPQLIRDLINAAQTRSHVTGGAARGLIAATSNNGAQQ